LWPDKLWSESSPVRCHVHSGQRRYPASRSTRLVCQLPPVPPDEPLVRDVHRIPRTHQAYTNAHTRDRDLVSRAAPRRCVQPARLRSVPAVPTSTTARVRNTSARHDRRRRVVRRGSNTHREKISVSPPVMGHLLSGR